MYSKGKILYKKNKKLPKSLKGPKMGPSPFNQVLARATAKPKKKGKKK